MKQTQSAIAALQLGQKSVRHAVFIMLVGVCVGCAGYPHTPWQPVQVAPRNAEGDASEKALSEESGNDSQTRFSEPPRAPHSTPEFVDPVTDRPPALNTQKKSLTLSVENMPLAAFINEVYGNLLGLNFQLDPVLQSKEDLVTLRIAEPQTGADLYALTGQVLQTYGVGIMREGDILRFSFGSGAAGEVPILVTGRTLPSVPSTHRPIFQVVPLHVVNADQMLKWLKDVLGEQPKLSVKADPLRAVIIVSGPESAVSKTLETIKSLDQPALKGRNSLRIDPAFWPAEELAKKLMDMLKAEGYDVNQDPSFGAVVVLPLKLSNSIVVFSASKAVLQHVKAWAAELDQPQADQSRDGLFAYEAKNTSARSLMEVLSGAGSGQSKANEPTSGAANAPIANSGAGGIRSSGALQTAGSATSTARFGEGNLVLDEARNTLLFMGKAADWQSLLPIFRKLDKPERMVLVEVVIAEVTLNEKEQFGVEWFFGPTAAAPLNSQGLGVNSSAQLLQGAFGANTPALNFVFDNAGQTKAILKALATDSRIKVLSNPHIMVRSGASANIDVGTQISTQTASTDITTGIDDRFRTSFAYVNTGVNLSVLPVVYSGNRVRLDIQQQVSSPGTKDAGDVNPPINNRSLVTSVSVRDGGAILVGGLITTNTSNADTKVPLLGDIPLLGQLFRSTSNSQTRTELMMLVIPYVVEDDNRSGELTDAFQNKLSEKVNPPEQKIE